MKKWFTLLALLFSSATVMMAQTTITGTITDESGEPLIGANVIAKGTAVGTVTDFDGKFSLEVNESSGVLSISYTGFAGKDVTYDGSQPLSITLEEGVALGEVVVTAFGVQRDKKALGYSVTSVDQENFELQGESDVARLLTGRVAGVQVNPSGGFLGGSTNVIVRSKGSITGNNQPLYVVDGSPFTGNISDLDPNNILNTSILKGLAASVLYGQEGRNGVILITTKNGALKAGERKLDINLSHTLTLNEVANLPDYQNVYGNGADNNTVIGFVGTWGGKFDPNVQVPHPYSTGRDPRWATLFPEFQGVTVPFVPVENNIEDFFGTGVGNTTNLNVTSSKDETSISFNLGYDNQKGYVEENTYEKINVGVGFLTKINERITLRANTLYTNIQSETPSGGLFDRLTYLPRSLDIHNLPFESPVDFSSVNYRTDFENPLWQLKNQNSIDTRNRTYTTGRLTYDLGKGFSTFYQLGYDTYNEESFDYSNKGGVNNQDNIIGWLQTTNVRDISLDQNFQVVMNPKYFWEDISVSALVGANMRSNKLEFDGLRSTDQVVYGVLDHDNFRTHAPANNPYDAFSVSSTGDFVERSNTLGLYGQVDFGYQTWLYMSLSGRNDWSSTIERENQSLFYPSVSMSIVPSDLIDFGKSVDYMKIRAGFATSAGFPQPYQTRATLAANSQAFFRRDGSVISTNSLAARQANPNLKPERSQELELGVDLNMFNSRIALDATFFNRINEDQILAVTRPLSTGVQNATINAGRIDTRGVEVGLSLVPVRSKNFTWDMYYVFTAFENEVKELPEDNLNVFANVNFAIEGEPLGTFRGTYAATDDNGNLLINPSNGKIIASDAIGLPDKIIGDPNEDWRGSVINTFSYKNFALSAQFEMVKGGDIYSVTTQNLLRRGVTTATVDGREGSYVIPGIFADPNTGEPILDENGNTMNNNIQINANDLFFLNTQDVDEAQVYDATTFRLRQVRLNYTLPRSSFGENSFIQGLGFNITGNNLWFHSPNLPKGTNVDPEVLGATLTDRAQGIDFQNDPSYRKISFSVQVNF